MPPSASSTIILQGPEDWDAWNNEFQSKATAFNLWEQIDPANENPEAFLTKPPEPKLEDHAAKRPIPVPDVGSSSTQGSRSETVDASPPISITRLTTEGQKTYQLAISIYTLRLKEHSEQHAHIRDLKNWITSTIAPTYRTTACKPTATIRDWYAKIKEEAGATESMIISDAKEKYKKAIAQLMKPPKDFNAWICNWEEAMSTARDKKIGEVSSTSSWFLDFLHAIERVMGQWATSYRLNKQEDAESGSLTYRMLANDFRKELRFQGKPSIVRKGAFGPSFGPDMDSAQGDASEGTERSASTGRNPAKSSSIQGPRNQGDKCPVCGLNHPLNKCYYANPDLAPEGFQPREYLQKRAASNLGKRKVAEQLEQLKQKKPKKESEDLTD